MAGYVKLSNKGILDAAVKNAEDIQVILNELSAVYGVPDEKIDELSLRMFYQDYLYDCHGKKKVGKTMIREWDYFKEDLEVSKRLEKQLNS